LQQKSVNVLYEGGNDKQHWWGEVVRTLYLKDAPENNIQLAKIFDMPSTEALRCP
jgi:hypothetical protein